MPAIFLMFAMRVLRHAYAADATPWRYVTLLRRLPLLIPC